MRKNDDKSVAVAGPKVDLRKKEAECTQDGVTLIFQSNSGNNPIFLDSLLSEVERVFSKNLETDSLKPFLTLGGRSMKVEGLKSDLYVPKPMITECKGSDVCIEPIFRKGYRRISFDIFREVTKKQQMQEPSRETVIWPYWNFLRLQMT